MLLARRQCWDDLGRGGKHDQGAKEGCFDFRCNCTMNILCNTSALRAFMGLVGEEVLCEMHLDA